MTGGTTAVVPVKRLAAAKSRLAGALTACQRADLVRFCFDHVLQVIQYSGEVSRCVVVTADQAMRDRAVRAGAAIVDEVEPNLAIGEDTSNHPHNRALEVARQVALTWAPESLLVVSADLPWLRPDEIRGLIARGRTAPGVVIAPDRRGRGTNALLLQPPDAIGFQFGDDSYRRHRRAAETAGLPVQVFDAPGTAFDVDLPEDLAAWHLDPKASGWGAVV